MIRKTFAAAVAAAFLAGAASAAPAAQQIDPTTGAREARIPFLSYSGIRTFRAVDRDSIYIRGRDRKWYRGTFIGPCQPLPFAIDIGVDTHGRNVLDRFSTIIADGERCQLHSLVRSDPPPPKPKRS